MSQELDLRYLQDNRKKTFKIGEDSFTVNAIFPKDELQIARNKSYAQGALPANSFSTSSMNLLDIISTIDVVLIEHPEWWIKAEDCPDISLLEEIYENIIKWTDEFQKKLKKNKHIKRSLEA